MAVKNGKRYGGPWYNDFRERYIFERGVRLEFPDIQSCRYRKGSKIWFEYELIFDVPEYEARRVHIKFKPSKQVSPRVIVDGPTDSPHRFHDDGGGLCIWYPWDPKHRRWLFSDGLLELLVLIQAHLFREAWWRETGGENGGEWLGPEVKH